jgi:hypothetical protein
MKNKKMWISLIVAAAISILAIILRVAPQQFRPDAALCRISAESDCRTAMMTVEQRRAGPAPGVIDDIHLLFIEFDDQGQMWNPAQVSKALDSLKALAAQRPVSVVVFAHGWNHDASADDGNARSFRDMLGQVFDAEAQFAQQAGRTPERAIVGVYLGWRGKSFTGPLQYPTFWARKAVAHRVGNEGAFEILSRLSAIRNGGIRPARNRLVLVGHSFGGALVFSATMHSLTESLEELSDGKRARFADLVVIINAAIEAQRFESLLRRSRELEASLRGQAPVFVAITSSNDMATKLAFPLGRRFSTVLASYRPSQKSGDGTQLIVDEARADRTAIGHYKPYVTHVLSACDAGSAIAALDPCEQEFQGRVSDAGSAAYMQAMRATAFSWNTDRTAPSWRIAFPSSLLYHAAGPVDGPVMNIVTHKSLIVGHAEIWESPIMLFVRDLIAINHFANARETGAASAEPTVNPP